MMDKLLKSPSIRALGVFTIAALLVAAIGVSSTGDTQAAAGGELYPPFHMVYVTESRSYGPVTTALTWRSEDSWVVEVVSSPGWEELVGSYESYEQGTLTGYSTVTGITERERRPSCEPTEGYEEVGVIPERWLFPEIYTAEYGWDDLGHNSDGHDQFQRGTEIYKVDPETRLVMEVGNIQDGEYVVAMRVMSLELLTEFDPTDK